MRAHLVDFFPFGVTYFSTLRRLSVASQLLRDLDDNKLPLFSNLPAPAIAKSYWKLGDEAMFRDLVLAVRCEIAAIDKKTGLTFLFHD